MKTIVEPSPDTPLVWFEVAIRGGASADPIGVEGLHRHAELLARRGAGSKQRAELDETLDGLGAALDRRQHILAIHFGLDLEFCAFVGIDRA